MAETTNAWNAARQALRIAYQIPVVVRTAATQLQLLTDNFSKQGLFLRTDEPIALQSFIRMAIPLTVFPRGFSLAGKVVRTVGPSTNPGHVPGVGIQLYANATDTLQEWHRFVDEVHAITPAELQRAIAKVLPPGSLADPVRRADQRTGAVLAVRFVEVQDLVEMYTRNISTGGMFVSTNEPLSVGENVTLKVSALGQTESVQLQARVRRLGREPGSWGVGVEFVDLDDQKKQALRDYITPLVFGE